MLIKDGYVLRCEGGAYGFSRLDIKIEKGVIKKIAPEIAADIGETVLSARDALVVPGLINAHVHSYSNLLKGTTQGEILELWSLETVALGGSMTQDEMKLAARLGIAEMLHCGVTSCIDHIPHPTAVDTIAEEYSAAGFRAAIAPMLHDRNDHLLLKGMREVLPADIRQSIENTASLSVEERMAAYRTWIERHRRDDGMLSVFLGPNSPQRCTYELLEAAAELAREYSMCVHTHMLETSWQRDTAEEDGDPIEKLRRAGLLGTGTSLAHCVWLSDEQIRLIAECGSTIVHNPASNLFLGSGAAPIKKYMDEGISLAFGSDGCNCGIGHNMLETARHAMFMHRSGGEWIETDKAWNALISGGARAMGMEDSLAAIEVGRKADITVWEANQPELMPPIDIAAQCMINLPKPLVRHSVINGEVVLKNGRISAFDEEALFEEIKYRSGELSEKFRGAKRAATTLRPWYEKAQALRKIRNN